MSSLEKAPTGRYVGLDALVGVLAVLLVVFLVVTMGVRDQKQSVVDECQERLLALAQAQQNHLVKNGAFADNLQTLRPFLEEEYRGMSYLCPITGDSLQVAVQGDKYLLIAPYTRLYVERLEEDFSINTGDPSW